MNINPEAVQKAAIRGHYHQATDIFLNHVLPPQEVLHLFLTSLQSIFQVLLQEQRKGSEENISLPCCDSGAIPVPRASFRGRLQQDFLQSKEKKALDAQA